MTATDFALLHQRLDLLTLEGLHSLDDASLPWLPPLQTLTRRRALRVILNSLRAIESVRQRLRSMAWLHCWLMQRNNVSPWTPFHCERSLLLTDFRKVLVGLASVLRSSGYDVALAWIADGGTVYTCIMTQDIERGLTHEHQVSYVALWPGLPHVAVHALENRAKRSVLRALHAVLLSGEPAAQLAVPPGGLGATLRASFPHLSLQVGESALNIPKVAKLQSLPEEPIPLGDEEKQRLETWNEALAELGPNLRPMDDRYTLTDRRGTWVQFEGPGLLEKLRKLYMSGHRAIISKKMKPAFLGKRYHVVQRRNK